MRMKTLAHYAGQGKWAYNRAVFEVKKEIPVFCVLVIAGYIKNKNAGLGFATRAGELNGQLDHPVFEHFAADSLNICNIGGELGDVSQSRSSKERWCAQCDAPNGNDSGPLELIAEPGRPYGLGGFGYCWTYHRLGRLVWK